MRCWPSRVLVNKIQASLKGNHLQNGSKGTFREQDLALLIDRKDRRYLITLKGGGTFQTHVGSLAHEEIIGKEPGEWFRTSRGQSLLAVKPTLGDFVLEMPRGTQIVYPKDLGNILMLGDIFPGATVVEAGLGSGALTATLLRAVGTTGRVVTYEVREDKTELALQNIRGLVPGPFNHSLNIADIYKGIQEMEVDRIVLDVPEPWHVVPWAGPTHWRRGGILLSFLAHYSSGTSARGGALFTADSNVSSLSRRWRCC